MANIKQRQKKDGTTFYEVTVFLGEQLVEKDGKTTLKQVRKSKSFTPPLTETGKAMTENATAKWIEEQARDWEKGLKGGDVLTKSITLSELFKLWDRKHLSISLAPKTANDYRRLWKRIEPFIGYIKADKVKVSDLSDMYTAFQQQGANLKTGGTVDVSHFHRMLSSFFNWAISEEFMTKNPCEKVKRPKHTPKKKQALDFEQNQ